ncbi:MAG: hypothetical protein ACI9R3_001610 [Verrucomicrobiales bacterium]
MTGETFTTNVFSFDVEITRLNNNTRTVAIARAGGARWFGSVVGADESQRDKVIVAAMPSFNGTITKPALEWFVRIYDCDITTPVFVKVPTHPSPAVGDLVGTAYARDVDKVRPRGVEEQFISFIAAVWMFMKFRAVEIESLKLRLLQASGGIDYPL